MINIDAENPVVELNGQLLNILKKNMITYRVKKQIQAR